MYWTRQDIHCKKITKLQGDPIAEWPRVQIEDLSSKLDLITGYNLISESWIGLNVILADKTQQEQSKSKMVRKTCKMLTRRNKKEKVLVLLKKEVVGETLFRSKFNCVFTHRPATNKLVVERESMREKEKETLNVRTLTNSMKSR